MLFDGLIDIIELASERKINIYKDLSAICMNHNGKSSEHNWALPHDPVQELKSGRFGLYDYFKTICDQAYLIAEFELKEQYLQAYVNMFVPDDVKEYSTEQRERYSEDKAKALGRKLTDEEWAQFIKEEKQTIALKAMGKMYEIMSDNAKKQKYFQDLRKAMTKKTKGVLTSEGREFLATMELMADLLVPYYKHYNNWISLNQLFNEGLAVMMKYRYAIGKSGKTDQQIEVEKALTERRNSRK